MHILSAIIDTIAKVKFRQTPKFYTSVILLINQSKEICEKQFSVVGSKGGGGANKPLNARTPLVFTTEIW